MPVIMIGMNIIIFCCIGSAVDGVILCWMNMVTPIRIGQIHDLSAHDPWYVWPLLMGVTMFIQQKMTPSTADPMQQKMMMFMPVMMTFMFLKAASGLVIYWTVSNVWGIGQQMITNRLIGPTAQRTVRPPAERQLKNVKNVGGGKTDLAAKDKDKERQ